MAWVGRAYRVRWDATLVRVGSEFANGRKRREVGSEISHMSSLDFPESSGSLASEPPAPLTRWQKFRLVVRVVELRLRFIALMAITGLVFAYWDTIWNQYDKWTRPSEERRVVTSTMEFFCPMHPHVVRDDTGSCPICGMPLSMRKKEERATLAEGVTARIELAPFRIRQAGIQTVEVGYSPMTETLTTVGTVEYDERKRAQVASQFKGLARVETLAVNFTGVAVKAGDKLGELSSPELFQASQELLLAKRSSRETPRTPPGSGRAVAADGVEPVRLAEAKLKLWGLTQAQSDEIIARGKAVDRLPIIAPIAGVVVQKNVVQGQYVAEGQAMFELADLSTVWVKAQVYEDQVGLVCVGQSVEATVRSDPGRRFEGQVAFVQPRVEPTTRTIEVRYDLDNQDRGLRPGMFATVTLKTLMAETPLFRERSGQVRQVAGNSAPQTECPVTHAKLGSMGDPIAVELDGRRVWVCCRACTSKVKGEPAKYLARLAPPPVQEVLSIPDSAVIDTGTAQVVYVETTPGVFEGRRVVLGPRSGDRISVLDGLHPGEKVATAGAFLIDAESRLNPATRGHSRSEPGTLLVPAASVPLPSPNGAKPLPSARPAESSILRSAPTMNLP
ncbi:membrane fusion protein, Cu(I)/Ag(I) efflux system [Singulisphaera sp. GP187]|uniref:efflux RND transporter periplasmic adaptor subunit n=1 Tax=Singulisphaera sp. GP187 TaxID=1882752 RepID=UPI0009265371|nr:efflux RND transporter periplasmic adaptor subunit [Singulisphaera sp. GP187]SIO61661.1 membrane fusion protein, Cu(I)/Ag(I) efflux system [Singulisphaera sp. GP187]